MADFEYIITSLKSNLTDQEIEDIKKEADRKGLGYVLYNGKSINTEKWANIGLPAKCHSNGVSLTGQ